jgi:shikimate dehydrogenase
MEEGKKLNKKTFGLVGKKISYSFSKGYFTDKFLNQGLTNHEYLNFDLESIQDFSKVIQKFHSTLKGVNVTIPYKQEIFKFLDDIDDTAKEVGAVNTVKYTDQGKLIGYNSDVVGFEQSIVPLLKPHHTKALILGTGGASKAVSYVFKTLGIDCVKVSRNAFEKREILYDDLTKPLLSEYTIIINCSPVGTFPNVNQKPAIPYQFITHDHLLYDLIYNPKETSFLSEGMKKGARTKNGYEMLVLQAEESWRIWNE